MPVQNIFGVPIVILSTIDYIDIDLVEQVAVQHQSNVTENPTETGRNVTDHIVNLPVVINMAGRFVDAPFAVGGVDVGFNPAQGFAAAANSGLAGGLSIQQWNALEDLRASRRPFDVVIQQGVYLNMVFRNLTGPRAKGDGTSQRFEAEMVQIVTTNVALLSAENIVSDDVGHTAGQEVDMGAQSTSTWAGA